MRGRTTSILIISVVFLTAAVAGTWLISLPDIFVSVLSHVPSHWLQQTGVVLLWAITSNLFPTAEKIGLTHFHNCFHKDSSETLKVLVAAQKGGTVFTSLLAWELATHCGLSLGVGWPHDDSWISAPDSPPEYEVDFLMALGRAGRWDEYIYKDFNKGKMLQCVVLTRDPFDRFLSLYKYTRDAGETGLRVYSNEMKKISNIEERVRFAWRQFGKQVMEANHDFLKKSLDRQCVQIKVDDLFKGSNQYDKNLELLFKTFGVKDEVLPTLIKAMEKHDVTRHTAEQRASNQHISGKSLEPGEKEFVKSFIRNDLEIAELLSKERQELNYDF